MARAAASECSPRARRWPRAAAQSKVTSERPRCCSRNSSPSGKASSSEAAPRAVLVPLGATLAAGMPKYPRGVPGPRATSLTGHARPQQSAAVRAHPSAPPSACSLRVLSLRALSLRPLRARMPPRRHERIKMRYTPRWAIDTGARSAPHIQRTHKHARRTYSFALPCLHACE